MNAKIEKLRAERSKNEKKISECQARNKEIDGQIFDLENNDIIGMLSELIQAMKQNPAATIHDRAMREEMEESQNED